MSFRTEDKKVLKKLAFLLYGLIVLLSLFTVASYTWFSLSRTPEVSDLGLYINTPVGMELAADPAAEEWTLQLNFFDLMQEEGVLKPVTWSENSQCFYAVSYGVDGRMSNTAKLEKLNDERHTNKKNADGHYVMATFYARTGEPIKVSLSPAVEVSEGIEGAGTYVIGTPVWNEQELLHDNGGSGAQYAIRLGFHIQKTDLEGNDLEEPPVFYVYEPNSDRHVEKGDGYIETPSVDGTTNLVPDDRLIIQTTSSWSEAMPVQKKVVIKQMGEFQADTSLFTLEKDQLARITLYVWLEGQDIDCTNMIGHKCQIVASVQFDAEYNAHTGLETIE